MGWLAPWSQNAWSQTQAKIRPHSTYQLSIEVDFITQSSQTRTPEFKDLSVAQGYFYSPRSLSQTYHYTVRVNRKEITFAFAWSTLIQLPNLQSSPKLCILVLFLYITVRVVSETIHTIHILRKHLHKDNFVHLAPGSIVLAKRGKRLVIALSSHRVNLYCKAQMGYRVVDMYTWQELICFRTAKCTSPKADGTSIS